MWKTKTVGNTDRKPLKELTVLPTYEQTKRKKIKCNNTV